MREVSLTLGWIALGFAIAAIIASLTGNAPQWAQASGLFAIAAAICFHG